MRDKLIRLKANIGNDVIIACLPCLSTNLSTLVWHPLSIVMFLLGIPTAKKHATRRIGGVRHEDAKKGNSIRLLCFSTTAPYPKLISCNELTPLLRNPGNIFLPYSLTLLPYSCLLFFVVLFYFIYLFQSFTR